jgi:lipopolysaccharide transport system ATP-binding protein
LTGGISVAEPVIQVEGLGKKYVLRHNAPAGAYVTLRDTLTAAARSLPARLLGRGDQAATREEFWALRDVGFDVPAGDVVGVIGRNGAGKSTLLKLLSRITAPTTGRIVLDGRVASLLEVGTGFHPELTGRENIFLNGAVLGMSREEIRRKYDEIVSFAGVERFLDTPVKRYSSGMYVRLAFAVAAHLEPEILLVDEVLAVGDAAFQKKCLAKVRSVSRSGRTIFFVSHNIGSVLEICTSAMLLDEGRLVARGPVRDVVAQYYARLNGAGGGLSCGSFSGPLRETVVFERLFVNDAPAGGHRLVSPRDGLTVRVEGRAIADVPDFRTTFSLFREGTRLLTMHDAATPERLPSGRFDVTFELPPFLLRPGEYALALGGRRVSGDDWIWGTDLSVLTVLEEWGPDCDPDDHGWLNVARRGRRVSYAAERNGVETVGS